jgi:hypothetical protein
MKWIGFFTLVALVYIHMQMNIISLAYQGKNKEKTIRGLSEDNGYLTYSILTLKSANNIGGRLLNEESDLKFIDPENVEFLPTSAEMTDEEIIPMARMEREKVNFFVNFLSFGAQAEAKGSN